jgi:DMSO reductase family type II enzyme chaperone
MNAQATDTLSERDLALCRSACWEALALGFRPPEPDAVRRLTSGAAGLVLAAGAVDPTLAALVRALARTDSRPDTLAAAHLRLFGHTARSEAPPYETEYGADDLFRQPQELADVSGFYAAFGLVPAPGSHERPDHVSCECEFMLVLARKEAWALEHGETGMLAHTRDAYRTFLRDHLARFVPSLRERLRRHDARGFYGRLGDLAGAMVRGECRRLDVRADCASLALRVPLDDTVPAACGSCPHAPGAAGAD